MEYRVYNHAGEDVTLKEQWLLAPDGTLYMETGDETYPLAPADDEYWYSFEL